MVDYDYAELYKQDSVDKQVKIEYNGGVITNEELFSESIELTESLCSESELRFGCCEASVLKFKVANIFVPLKGMWLEVSETLAGNADEPFAFGRYKVCSDKPTADRRYRDIVAYDAMYDILNEEMSDWYNALLPDEKSTVTLKEFRTSFISYFGLEQEEVSLINDDMIIERTIEPSQISGKDIITAICEINGCFGHIGRDGKFRYIHLEQEIEGLYPANDLYPADDLFPADPKSTGISKSLYISCQYEDFVTKGINKLQIRQEENDIGAIVGTGDNCYIIEDNFLVYGKSAEDLENIANNVFSVIAGVKYRPFSADCKGNPCFEVGDAVRLSTKYELVETYILKRTLKGIQALRDNYSAEGVEEYSEKVNSLNRQIIQLKGKTNVLERTVEETKSQITNAEAGLQSTITQTAEEIRSEVSKTYQTKDEATTQYTNLASSITQTAEQIKSEVAATYETQNDAKSAYSTLQSSIIQTASEIRSEVSATYQTQAGADSQYESLSSSITQNAESISTKVSKGSVSSEISQEAGIVSISANRFELQSDKLTIDQSGNLTSIGGAITAGTITGSVIQSDSFTQDDNGWATEGLRIQGDGTTKIYFLSVGHGGIASCYNITTQSNVEANLGTVSAKQIVAGAGGLSSTGTKSRVVSTENYGDKLLYCYEMPNPLFGDVGNGKTDSDGVCVVFIDDIFSDAINTTDCSYSVFLTAYGPGDFYISERTASYFAVRGEPNTEFAWEIKAKQRDYEYTRLETFQTLEKEDDLLESSANYIETLEGDLLSESADYVQEAIEL